MEKRFKRILMSKNNIIFAIIILFSSIFIGTTSSFASTTNENVKITNIITSSSEVKDGEKVAITVGFSGNGNVKPGDKLTISLPQPSSSSGGLHGIRTTIPISATAPDGSTIADAATAEVNGYTVTITFNDGITQLTNGFSGTFTFQAIAEKGSTISGTDGKVDISKDWGTNVQGPSIVITTSTNNSSSSNSGVNSGNQSSQPVTPPDTTVAGLTKGGYQGTDGNLNWSVYGTVSANAQGPIVITDTPSPSVPIDWNSWRFYLTDAQGNKFVYTVNELEQHGINVDKNQPTGGFTVTDPNGTLAGTKWAISYRCMLENPETGASYDNGAEMAYGNENFTDKANITIQQHGQGEIIGYSSGKLTLLKEDADSHTLLAGAKFELTNTTSGKTMTATSDAEGKIAFDNLLDGKYVLKEVQAPDGYELSDKQYQFTIQQGKMIDSDLPTDNIVSNVKIPVSSSSSSSESSSTSSEVPSSSSESNNASSEVSSSSSESSSASSEVPSSSSESNSTSSEVSSSSSESNSTSSEVPSSSSESSSASSEVPSSSSKSNSTSSEVPSSSSESNNASSEISSSNTSVKYVSSSLNSESSSLSTELSSSNASSESSASKVSSSSSSIDRVPAVVTTSSSSSAKTVEETSSSEVNAKSVTSEISSNKMNSKNESKVNDVNGKKASVATNNSENAVSETTVSSNEHGAIGVANGSSSTSEAKNGTSQNKGKNQVLPQTGEMNTSSIVVIGMVLLALAGSAIIFKRH
nr:SpaA isopeptide-forming pilin-related protein [uncultured Ligilactobacillus sp.]